MGIPFVSNLGLESKPNSFLKLSIDFPAFLALALIILSSSTV